MAVYRIYQALTIPGTHIGNVAAFKMVSHVVADASPLGVCADRTGRFSNPAGRWLHALHHDILSGPSSLLCSEISSEADLTGD